MLRIETFTGPAWQWEGLAPVNLSLVPMASTPPARLKRDAPRGPEGRHPPLHILFVHSHIAEVERCLKVLDKLHFTVSAEVVVTPEEFTERLCRGAYDLVVAEHPSPNWRERQALELLHLSNRQIPLIFVGSTLQRETVADFITKGAYDCIEMDHIGHLPVAVHRALDEKALRDDRDRAKPPEWDLAVQCSQQRNPCHSCPQHVLRKPVCRTPISPNRVPCKRDPQKIQTGQAHEWIPAIGLARPVGRTLPSEAPL